MPLDIVVPVRSGAINQELRYALRSWVVHLPHRHVWIVGYRPPWLTGVRHIETRQVGNTKWVNTTNAVRAACEHPDVSDPFIYADDDMFVMAPQPDVLPVYHRGPMLDLERVYAARGTGAYLHGMRQTHELLTRLGHPNPVSYELHLPLPVDKAGMLHALDVGRHIGVPHKRTLYGVLHEIGGQQMTDVKVMHRAPRDYAGLPFLSTSPDAFTNGAVGAFIRGRFPNPSPYEIPGRR